MLAFSCVHCGQRMKITDDQEPKRASCPGCGQEVFIPDKASGVRTLRRARPRPEAATPPPERPLSPAPKPFGDLPTRVEPAVAPPPATLTSFLAPPQSPDEIGRLGPYRILGVVGSGGMGVVFRAEEPMLDRVVAVKAMLPHLASTETAKQRFLREARTAAGVMHDNVVTVFRVDEDRGVPYLVMPFLEGEPLDRRLTRAAGPLGPREVLRILGEMASGLDAIHRRGLVHRDVKPGNVWLEGGGGRVKILDFGLARSGGDAQLTHEGAVVGSPAFMAPEQASRRPVDHRADLFALGCVAYVMATGRLPFEGDDALSTMLAVTTRDPVAPGEANPDLPAEVEELILELLAKEPAGRPASARAVQERVRKVEGWLG